MNFENLGSIYEVEIYEVLFTSTAILTYPKFTTSITQTEAFMKFSYLSSQFYDIIILTSGDFLIGTSLKSEENLDHSNNFHDP